MLDPTAVTQLIEQQIAKSVDNQVIESLADKEWMKSIEDRLVKYAQDRILGKFTNSSALPELVEAVKTSVSDLFDQGKIPNIQTYVDPTVIKQTIDSAVQQTVDIYLTELASDPDWIEKIQKLADHWLVQKTLDQLKSTDLRPIIKEYINEAAKEIETSLGSKLTTPGIQDIASQLELTVMDDHVVIENSLTAKNLQVIEGLTVDKLAVTGTINTNNRSWDTLAENISQKTLNKLTDEWRSQLVKDVADSISQSGIDFDNVTLDNEPLLKNGNLNHNIVNSNLQTVGKLKDLTVTGCAQLNNTVTVNPRRLGINTQDPESALSIWDEEVSLLAGKFKDNTAQFGTSKKQGLNLVVNRNPAVEIDAEGVTAIKKLKVGVWSISFAPQVPNYSGARGDIVFNSNPGPTNSAFAWVCLGTFQWKTLRAIE